MAENYEVFKTDIDIAIKNAKDTLKDLKAIQAGLKGMDGYSVDLSKNFKNLQTTLKQFSARNISLFGKDFSKYINDTSSKFEKLDTTIDSLFKKLPNKVEPAVVLLKKRFGELRAEIATTETILSSLEKHSINIGKLEKAKSTPGLSPEKVVVYDTSIAQEKAKRQAIIDQLKEEGRTVKDVEDLYKQQLKSLGEIGVQVKAVGEGQARAANAQREYNQQLKESVAEQAKLVKETEKQAEKEKIIAVQQERFKELQKSRTSIPTGGVIGLVQSYKDMVSQVASIETGTKGLKGFLDTSRQVFDIWSEAYVGGKFGKSIKDITYGIDLLNTKGTNTFNNLKLAIYGMGDPTDKLGKFLVKAADSLENFKYSQYAVTRQSADYINIVSDSVARTKKQITALGEQAKASDISVTAFTGLNTKLGESRVILERVQSLMQKGASPGQVGLLNTAYIKAVNSLNLEFAEAEKHLVTVYKLSNDPKSMHPLIAQLREAKTVTTETKQALNQASDAIILMAKGSTVVPFVDKLKRKLFELLDPMKHMKSEAELVGKGVHALTGTFEPPIQKATLLNKAIQGSVQVANTFKDAMTGAIIGSFLGPIFSEALQAVKQLFNILLTPIRLPLEALLAPFRLLSSVIGTITNQVQSFFASLPSEFLRINSIVQNFNLTLRRLLTGYSKDVVEKSIEGANKFIREINAKTPFTLETSQAAFQQLTIAGLNARKWLEPVSDAASTLNKDMGQLIFAMQRLKSGSKGMGVQMIKEFGIPVKEIGVWTDATGKAIKTQELFKDGIKLTDDELKASGLVFKKWEFEVSGAGEELKNNTTEALEIFNGYLQQNAKFAGASAARANTFTGILSNLNVAVAVMIESFGQPIFQKFTDILNDVYGVVLQLQNAIEPFAKVIGAELATSLQNLWASLTGITTSGVDELGNRLEGTIDIIKSVSTSIMQFLKPALMVILAIVKGDFPKAWGLFLKAAQDVLKKISEWLKGASGQEWVKWGVGLVKQIAQGLITGAKTFIKGAVSVISSTIASFLKPGSPPREGPLSTIHTWGRGLIETFSQGFKLADMSFLTGITENIKGALSSLGLDQFKSIRKNVIAIIGGINQTGQINEELWASIQKQIGNGNAELSQFVRLTLELKQVTKEYQDAEKAGFIPKELQDRLDAAQLAVALKEEELKLQEQVNQASGAATGGSAGGVEAPIDLKKQLNDELELLKKRKKIGLITEKEYLEGVTQLRRQYAEQFLVAGKEGEAKDQLKLAQQTDKKLFEQDKEFLEKKRKLGLVTEAEYLSQLQDLNKQEAERLLLAGDEGAAKQKIEEAKSLQKQIDKAALVEQKKALEKQIKQEQDILKIKFDKGLITEQEYREGLVKIQEGYIDQLLQMGYPVDKEIDNLKKLKEELAALTPVPEDAGKDIATYSEDVTGELQKMMDDVISEFSTLGTSTWDEFSKTFHDAFDGIWTDISSSIFGGEGGGLGDVRANLLAWAGSLWTDLTAEGGPLSDMTNFFNRISEGFTTWAEGKGKEKVKDIGKMIGNTLVEGVLGAIGLGGTTYKSGIIGSISGFFASIREGMLTLTQYGFAGIFEAIINRIFKPEDDSVIAKAITEFATGYTQIVTGIIDLVFYKDFPAAIERLKEGYSTTFDSILTLIREGFSKGVIDLIKTFIDNVKSNFQDLYNWLVGESLIPDLINEIVALFTSLPERLTELDLLASITDLFPTFEDMQALGARMMEGLKQGWIDMQETLHTTFDAIIPQWIRDRLSGNSPPPEGPLSVPINWNYLNDGVPEAVGTLKATLTQGLTEVAQTTQTTMFNMKNAITEGVTSSVETVKKSMFDMKNAVSSTVQEIDSTMANSSIGEGLGSGFGSYGQNSGDGPSIGAQGGIAASWRRFFALLKQKGSISTHQYAQGSVMISHTQKALVHKGEMIIPSKMAQVLRTQMLSPNTNVNTNSNQSKSYMFQAGAFAGAFPNVTKSKEALDAIKQIEQMVGKSEMRARVV